jgi:hypothetical protein
MYLSKPLYVAITIIIIIIIEYVQHLKVIKSYLLEVSIIYLWYKRYLTSLILSIPTLLNKGNNKITELRTILQRESQNS